MEGEGEGGEGEDEEGEGQDGEGEEDEKGQDGEGEDGVGEMKQIQMFYRKVNLTAIKCRTINQTRLHRTICSSSL